MNRQIILTIIGIALSFAIASGGWILTSIMIERKSEALLAIAGMTPVSEFAVNQQAEEPADTHEDKIEVEKKERPRLTDQEMAYVLANWTAGGSEQAHEPMRTQLSMEEAIDAAKSGLLLFSERGHISQETLADMLETEKISAYLCQNHVSGQSAQFLDPIYSYWTVTFTSDWMAMVFTINAVTGQVWKAGITFYALITSFEQEDAMYILNTFAAYLGKEGEYNIHLAIGGNELLVLVGFTDSKIGAHIDIKAIQTSRNKLFNVYEMEMYLSAQ